MRRDKQYKRRKTKIKLYNLTCSSGQVIQHHRTRMRGESVPTYKNGWVSGQEGQ